MVPAVHTRVDCAQAGLWAERAEVAWHGAVWSDARSCSAKFLEALGTGQVLGTVRLLRLWMEAGGLGAVPCVGFFVINPRCQM